MIYGEDVRRIFEPATRCESRAHSSEELAERGGGAEERTKTQKNGMQMHLAGKWHKCHHRERRDSEGGGGRWRRKRVAESRRRWGNRTVLRFHDEEARNVKCSDPVMGANHRLPAPLHNCVKPPQKKSAP